MGESRESVHRHGEVGLPKWGRAGVIGVVQDAARMRHGRAHEGQARVAIDVL